MQVDGPFELNSRMPNLLSIHFQLSKMRDIEDNATYYAALSTEDVRRTIKRHFAPLDELVAKFDATLFEIAENLLEIVREGNRSLVVRVAKIIDVEEKQDLAAQIVEEIQRDSSEPEPVNANQGRRKSLTLDNQLLKVPGAPGAPNPTEGQLTTANDSAVKKNRDFKAIMGSLKKLHRIRRGYPERFFNAIQNSIHNIFQECRKAYDNDPDAILDNLDWIFGDLGLAQAELGRLTPERWKVFNKYVNFYHVELYKLLDEILATEPSAIILLKILQYVKVYYKKMQDGLGISRDDDGGLLVPPLLDGREEKLYDDYLALIVGKLHEWKNNLSANEKTAFIQRESPPEIKDDKKLGLQGEAIMFSIISQQIDVAAESTQGRILLGTVEECGTILKERQQSWEETVEDEVFKELQDSEEMKAKDPNYVPPPSGLIEYLMALANDQIRGADYAEALSNKTSSMVSKKYKTPIIAVWDSVCDGFVAVAKTCITGLIRIVFKDLEPAFKAMFAKSEWYKGKPMTQVVDTIQEYVSDGRNHLSQDIFEVFLDDLLEETILHYLASLSNPGVSLKAPKATERIKSDLEAMYLLFTSNHEDPGHVQSHFRVFEHLLATLEAPVDMLPQVFMALRSDFWDAPLELFEAMVRSRKDIDAKMAREIISAVRNQALHQSQNTDQQPQQATYLSQFGKSSR